MRTHKKYGILMAGTFGYKIYNYNSQLIVTKGAKLLDIPNKYNDAIMKYVNIRYYPLNEQDSIKQDFLKIVREYT